MNKNITLRQLSAPWVWIYFAASIIAAWKGHLHESLAFFFFAGFWVYLGAKQEAKALRGGRALSLWMDAKLNSIDRNTIKRKVS